MDVGNNPAMSQSAMGHRMTGGHHQHQSTIVSSSSSASRVSPAMMTMEPNNSNDSKKNSKKKSTTTTTLRQGKWTREEEDYVHCLMEEFKAGTIPLAEGTSLRTFLSKMLHCDPMRISKKFVGSQYNGKQIYIPTSNSNGLRQDQVRARRAKLCELERRFLVKIGMDTKNHHRSSNISNLGPSPALIPKMASPSSSGMPMMMPPSATPGASPTSNLAKKKDDGLSFIRSTMSKSKSSNSAGENLFKAFLAAGGSEPSSGSRANLPFGLAKNSIKSSSNRGAAEAGRALLLGGTTTKSAISFSSSNTFSSQKPLSAFTSSELTAELKKRSASEATNPTTNNNDDWLDRQNSIDSFSNLIVARSAALQSIKSLGHLLDPISGSTFNLFAGSGSGTTTTSSSQQNWRPSNNNGSRVDNRKQVGSLASASLRNLQARLSAARESRLNLAQLLNGNNSNSASQDNWTQEAQDRMMSGRLFGNAHDNDEERRDGVELSTPKNNFESDMTSMLEAWNNTKQSSSSSSSSASTNELGAMMETFKRKYMNPEGIAVGGGDDQRRTKPFR